VSELATRLASPVVLVALGAYGRRHLTPRADVEVLFLHGGDLALPDVTEVVCYPVWQQGIHVEPFVRTLEECVQEWRRSWASATRFLDARHIGGDPSFFTKLETRLQPLRRDVDRLRHRLRTETAHRHATHPSAVAATTPNLVAGRGGLMDAEALRWLGMARDERTCEALDFLLATISAAEALTEHSIQVLSQPVMERLDAEGRLLGQLYGHARRIAFQLDSALAPERADRSFGPMLALERNQLIAQRLPPLERAPALGLRLANLVGLAPPSEALMDWASSPGPPLDWDGSALEQWWLLLRAADWRAFEFLLITGLLTRYLPELASVVGQPGQARTGDLALDSHAFLSLRRLHEWSEGEDPLSRRAWRAARQRDWVYLAVLLHELDPEQAGAAARRLSAPADVLLAISLAVSTYQLVLDTVTRRDLHDEDLVLELAARIGSRQHLGMLFLVAIAHELGAGDSAWSTRKADLLRQLFTSLELALRQPSEVGIRRTRSLEQRRDRIISALQRRNLYTLAPVVGRLPRRYVLTISPALASHHLALLASGPLGEGEVRMRASRRRQPGLWDLLIVARDRPGVLATMAGVLTLRGASILAADAATSSDGLVLDVFTVGSSAPLDWSQIETDLRAAVAGRIPLEDLLGSRPVSASDTPAVHVLIDNAASQFFSVVEVRAPDEVGLLYRIANALHREQLDIHHARIATHPEGALDVFYVRTLSGRKLSDPEASHVAAALTARLRAGQPLT